MKLLEDRAARNQETLDNLPPNLGGAVKELTDYEFMDPDAQSQFQELLDMLKQRMMENTFQNMRQQLQDMTPQDMAALREMLRDLNQMLQDRMQGQGSGLSGIHGQARRDVRGQPAARTWTSLWSDFSSRWPRPSL